MTGLTFHHVGCLVEKIEHALKAFEILSFFGQPSSPCEVRSQKVRVCFQPLGNGSFLELVEPAPDNAFLLRLLRKGVSFYHIGCMCENIEAAVAEMTAAGAHELIRFNSEAFNGNLCVFLTTTDGQMIEMIESKV